MAQLLRTYLNDRLAEIVATIAARAQATEDGGAGLTAEQLADRFLDDREQGARAALEELLELEESDQVAAGPLDETLRHKLATVVYHATAIGDPAHGKQSEAVLAILLAEEDVQGFLGEMQDLGLAPLPPA